MAEVVYASLHILGVVCGIEGVRAEIDDSLRAETKDVVDLYLA